MAVQTSYPTSMVAGYAGMIAEMGDADLISRTVETAAGISVAGVPVKQGTNDNGCAALAANTDAIVGITVRDQSATADLFAQDDTALLMREGVLWVTVTDAGGVAAGDAVWVKVADGTFSNADLGTSQSIKINNARWDSSAANGAVAKIRFDLEGGCTAGA